MGTANGVRQDLLETSKTEGEYSEESFRTLIELFCDWGPSRSPSSKASAADSIDNLSTAEKRDLYERCCSELARNLEGQYGYDVSESDIRQFAETLATDETNEYTSVEHTPSQYEISSERWCGDGWINPHRSNQTHITEFI